MVLLKEVKIPIISLLEDLDLRKSNKILNSIVSNYAKFEVRLIDIRYSIFDIFK